MKTDCRYCVHGLRVPSPQGKERYDGAFVCDIYDDPPPAERENVCPGFTHLMYKLAVKDGQVLNVPEDDCDSKEVRE
jgi:hypothetical protein